MKITVVVLKASQKSDNHKSTSAFFLHFDSFFLDPSSTHPNFSCQNNKMLQPLDTRINMF